jgi:hypothetical protein
MPPKKPAVKAPAKVVGKVAKPKASLKASKPVKAAVGAPAKAPRKPKAPAAPVEHVARSREFTAPGTGVVRLEQWSCTWADPYRDPREPGNLCLQGIVFGHPRIPEGEHIVTSSVVSFRKRDITTASRIYRLGKIDPKYAAWMLETQNERLDDDDGEPLRWVSRG